MEIEAALAPSQIRLDSERRIYALRLAALPKNHPINVELHKSLKLRKSTQMKMIKKSIPGLTEHQNLEAISHFAFPPWKSGVPYSVDIIQSDRDMILKSHQHEIEAMDPKINTRIYTDVSMTKKSTGVGVAVIATGVDGEFEYEETRNIGPEAIVCNGELEAIAMVAEFADLHAGFGHQYHIYSDSQGALYRLKQLSDRYGQ